MLGNSDPAPLLVTESEVEIFLPRIGRGDAAKVVGESRGFIEGKVSGLLQVLIDVLAVFTLKTPGAMDTEGDTDYVLKPKISELTADLD